MSGGAFDYKQYSIGQIADDIQQEIEKSGRAKTKEELDQEFYYGEDEPDPNHYRYPDEVLMKFIEAVRLLRKAEVYAHRIDWLLSGDDGEEQFLRRLKQDLNDKERFS